MIAGPRRELAALAMLTSLCGRLRCLDIALAALLAFRSRLWGDARMVPGIFLAGEATITLDSEEERTGVEGRRRWLFEIREPELVCSLVLAPACVVQHGRGPLGMSV